MIKVLEKFIVDCYCARLNSLTHSVAPPITQRVGSSTQLVNSSKIVLNRIHVRSVVDFVTGTLSDQRSRFLGAKSVRLHKVLVQGLPAMLALSTKPWLCYNFQGKYHCTKFI